MKQIKLFSVPAQKEPKIFETLFTSGALCMRLFLMAKNGLRSSACAEGQISLPSLKRFCGTQTYWILELGGMLGAK